MRSIVFCWALLLALPASAQSQLADLLRGTELTSALSGLQVSVMERREPGDSVALGFAQITAAGPVALRRDHKPRVASISKLLVAIAVMRLVEAGRLDLDADVSDYLGWQLRNPAYADVPISARQLLSHSSSIRDGSRYFIAAGEGELREFFAPDSRFWDNGEHYAQGPGREPGRFFSYSNLNFGLLGTLIERISRQRFDRFMVQEVLEPMQLSASFNPCDLPATQLAAAFRKRSVNGDWNPQGPWIAQVDAPSAALLLWHG